MRNIKTLGLSVVALSVLLLCALPLTAQDNASPKPVVRHAVTFDVSPPLRELAKG